MSNILSLAQQITELETQLQNKKAELASELGGVDGVATKRPGATASKGRPAVIVAGHRISKDGPSVADRVRRALSNGAALTFGELWERVEKGGGTKFALKSALNKGRERKEFKFAGGKYALVTTAKKTPSPKPPKSTGTPRQRTAPQKKNPAGQVTSGVQANPS